MREIKHDLDFQKTRVKRLQGIDVAIKVNRGRNKISEYHGRIADLYPQLFTFETGTEKFTFSYSDLLTKNVLIFPSDAF